MEIGDSVNIKATNGFWKGKIVSITDKYNDSIVFKSPILTIEGVGIAHVTERQIYLKDGEYWES